MFVNKILIYTIKYLNYTENDTKKYFLKDIINEIS